ncbi:tubulin monoglutamylase TTLL4 [Parambassis ranga]|uniref:Tubulin polyglutamylase TTLL4 n=1 Tax=Parambassis ranga TaxID=210632 RepID=A0A6P7HMW4_9TELE|nr:tubulin polyglutamylase TTLL4 [Parambassis ranga]XP_028249914.1 tubulin polyglutamylase TTLL4 [Parambassis ranga]
MPTNQSSPWGGGKLLDSPTAPASIGPRPRTAAATKVPFSQTSVELSRRRDHAKPLPCDHASSSAAPSSLTTLWQRGDTHKTWNQFAAVPDGSLTLPPKPNGTQTLASGPRQAGGVPQAGDAQPPPLCHQDLLVSGQPTPQDTHKLKPEAADRSSLPSVPHLCLTVSRHQGGKNPSVPDSTKPEVRSTRRERKPVRRSQSAKLAAKRCHTLSGCTAAVSGQLLIRGVPPAVLAASRKTAAALDVTKPAAGGQSRRTSRVFSARVGGRQEDPAGSRSIYCAPTLREVKGRCEDPAPPLTGGSSSPAGALVGSVTSQISAIHLTRKVQLASSSSLPPAERPQLSGPECAMQVDGAEEELPDELENVCSDDDDSDCSSITGSSSTESATLFSSVEEPMLLGAEDNREERPALVPSLFPLIPPTLYFSTINEKVELLSVEQRRLLKWKMSSVTPNVVKQTVTRSHFRVTKKSHDWLGCWGHHMRSPGFKTLGEHQKLNHFPGTFQIGRKDRLWRNLSKMQLRFGKQEFSFFPRTFILPQDIKRLRKAWEDGSSRQKWIIKPPASARGMGIQVIHKWSQMPRKRPLLVQKYLHKPYLIGGNKFDLRIYVYVTSYDPLRVYIFSDGLVRFASCKYSSSMKTLSNKFMHLTNYSVNKKNSEYQTNSDDKACQGHKWALKALWQYLGSKGINTTPLWEKIKDIVIKTIIASEPYVNNLLKTHVRTPYSCHELFGFDIMLDENLKPWILEVNISPSLHSNTALDVSVKGQMIRDLLNLAGLRIPSREDVVTPCSSASSSTSSLCGANRERSKPDLSADEKVKRAFYLTQRNADQDFLSTVLDVLTPEDVRILAESEDELSRRGEFERIFPSPASSRYLRFFECPRYLNILLDQWEQKYCSNRTKCIGVLRTLCQKGVHLGTTDPAHMWSKCSYVSKFESHRHDGIGPSTSRVVVSHRRRFRLDDDDDDDGRLDREVGSASSLPVSPSPGSSVSSSACASPQPGLSQSLLPQHFASL